MILIDGHSYFKYIDSSLAMWNIRKKKVRRRGAVTCEGGSMHSEPYKTFRHDIYISKLEERGPRSQQSLIRPWVQVVKGIFHILSTREKGEIFKSGVWILIMIMTFSSTLYKDISNLNILTFPKCPRWRHKILVTLWFQLEPYGRPPTHISLSWRSL